MAKSETSHGFTLVELMLVVAVIGVVAAMAAPGLLRARMSGNEAAAVATLRAIGSAQHSYAQHCNAYGTNLPDLAFTPGGTTNPFLPPDLTSGITIVKSGYIITMTAGDGNVPVPNVAPGCPAGSGSAFYVAATPSGYGSTGSRVFATNAPGSIWQNLANAPIPEPFVAGGTISPLH